MPIKLPNQAKCCQPECEEIVNVGCIPIFPPACDEHREAVMEKFFEAIKKQMEEPCH